jgi:SAM-dependent methyltransferase
VTGPSQGLATRIRRAGAGLPGPLKSAIQTGLGTVDPLVVRRWRDRTGDRDPLPPLPLRARVGSASPDAYRRSGTSHVTFLEEGLAAGGRAPEEFTDVLDLACGSGRVLIPWIERHPGPRYAGCDIDGPAIAWLQRHCPAVDARVTSFEPPLPWPDGAFDLVLSFSLFSHLDEPAQWAWLREVRRLLRPGGAALLTIHGRRGFERMASGDVVSAAPAAAVQKHAPLAPGGFVYVPVAPTRWNALRFIKRGAGFGLTFHDEEYVTTRWQEVFGSVEIVNGGEFQAAVLVEP